jgi:hypothetical protein
MNNKNEDQLMVLFLTRFELTMAIYQRLEMLARIDDLIRRKATGSPTQMARKIGKSLRAWHKIREELIQDLGWPIAFDRERNTYFYTSPNNFHYLIKGINGVDTHLVVQEQLNVNTGKST